MKRHEFQFVLPQLRVLFDQDDALAAWATVKGRTLDDLFGQSLDKVRVVRAHALVEPVQGEDDEKPSDTADA